MEEQQGRLAMAVLFAIYAVAVADSSIDRAWGGADEDDPKGGRVIRGRPRLVSSGPRA
jgi:hypothetical protein